MDRFVMGRAVANEVELLHTKRNLFLPAAEVGVTRGERVMSGGNPERRQISRLHEITPEPEWEFCDDTPMHLRSSTSSSCSVTRLLDVRRSLLIERDDVEPRCPGASPMCPVAELPIERVARKYLDHRRKLHDARCGAHVPFVEGERVGNITTARAQVRTEALCCD